MSRTDPPGLELARLRAYLDEHRPGLAAGELSAEVVQGGRSNLTYIVRDGAAQWVVRRPPLSSTTTRSPLFQSSFATVPPAGPDPMAGAQK